MGFDVEGKGITQATALPARQAELAWCGVVCVGDP